MSLLGNIGASVVLKVSRRLIRDNKMKREGRAEVFKLWKAGVSYEEAKRKLR